MDVIQVPLWGWAATVAGLILLVVADLVLGSRHPRAPRRARAEALRLVPLYVRGVLPLHGRADGLRPPSRRPGDQGQRVPARGTPDDPRRAGQRRCPPDDAD